MLWTLLVAPSFASAKILTCNYGDSLESIVGIAKRNSGPQVIYVDTDCNIDGIDYLDFSPGSGGASDFTVMPVDSGSIAEIPPVRVSGGATLALESITVTTTSATIPMDTVVGDLLADSMPGAAIYVEDGRLDLDTVSLAGGEGAGVVVVDSVLHVDGLEASGFDTYAALYLFSSESTVTADMSDVTLYRNGAGGMVAFASDKSISVQMTTPNFSANGPVLGADIYAYGVDSFTVDNGTFDSSDGADASPVYLQGGTFTCSYCTFTDTTGTTASTVAAYLASADTLLLENSTFTPGNAVDPVLHVDTGGTFQVSGSFFSGAGRIDRYGGSTYIGTSRFSGAVASPDALVMTFYGTNATLDGLTICDYPGTGWGLIGVYVSTFTLYDSVLQGIDAGGDPIVRAFDVYGDVDITVRDNTVAASDSVFVGGSPTQLSYTNNLLAGVTGGIDVDATPEVYNEGYNLWWQVDDPIAGAVPAAIDVVDEDPLFVPEYDPTVCGTYPFLREGSPANAAGDPARNDGYGNSPSDIGAIDFDDPDGPDDTGVVDPGDDTGATGPDDSGAVGDSAPNDGLGPVVIGGALHPCECGGGGSAAGVWLLLLPLLRRRK